MQDRSGLVGPAYGLFWVLSAKTPRGQNPTGVDGFSPGSLLAEGPSRSPPLAGLRLPHLGRGPTGPPVSAFWARGPQWRGPR